MSKIIAYCGLVCTDCEAYVATQANDLETLERLAARARNEFGIPDATTESAMCDGCLADSGRQIGYCAVCEIRTCGVARSIANCAHCTDYACEKLMGFFERATDARTVLDGSGSHCERG